jgi:membrane associated rhomboid family serine protease
MTTENEYESEKSLLRDVEAEGSWVKVGLFAATSALAGGLAAAWYYRKTLARLREAEAKAADPPSQDAGSD